MIARLTVAARPYAATPQTLLIKPTRIATLRRRRAATGGLEITAQSSRTPCSSAVHPADPISTVRGELAVPTLTAGIHAAWKTQAPALYIQATTLFTFAILLTDRKSVV